MIEQCPSCGDNSYQTYKEKEKIAGGIIGFTFFSECTNCGYTPGGE